MISVTTEPVAGRSYSPILLVWGGKEYGQLKRAGYSSCEMMAIQQLAGWNLSGDYSGTQVTCRVSLRLRKANPAVFVGDSRSISNKTLPG